ncbi:MAG: hypothetical protein ACMUJM_02670 [bacterium]
MMLEEARRKSLEFGFTKYETKLDRTALHKKLGRYLSKVWGKRRIY